MICSSQLINIKRQNFKNTSKLQNLTLKDTYFLLVPFRIKWQEKKNPQTRLHQRVTILLQSNVINSCQRLHTIPQGGHGIYG